jgi:hypothetical protein
VLGTHEVQVYGLYLHLFPASLRATREA